MGRRADPVIDNIAPFLPSSFACLAHPRLVSLCVGGRFDSDESDEDGEEELQQGGKGATGGVEKGKASGGADKGKAQSPKVWCQRHANFTSLSSLFVREASDTAVLSRKAKSCLYVRIRVVKLQVTLSRASVSTRSQGCGWRKHLPPCLCGRGKEKGTNL